MSKEKATAWPALPYQFHYYSICEPFPPIAKLFVNGVMSYCVTIFLKGDNHNDSGYKVTKRGEVFVDYIRNLPLPEASWSMST